MQVWDLLTKLSERYPVDGNKGGSYLTMLSKGGFVFGIINIIGNFGAPSPPCTASAQALASCTLYAAAFPAALFSRYDAWSQNLAEGGSLKEQCIAAMTLAVCDQMPMYLQVPCTTTR